MRDELLTLLTETCPGIDFENETALVDEGIITSFDLVAIVSEIMAQFSVEIDIDDLLPENFNSLDAIEKLIKRAEE